MHGYMHFNKSLSKSKFPFVWETSRITSIIKAGDTTLFINYRHESNLSFPRKASRTLNKFEKFLYQYYLLINMISSTKTNSLLLSRFIRDAFKNQTQVDIIFTDFSKTFHSVDYDILIHILVKLDIKDLLLS